MRLAITGAVVVDGSGRPGEHVDVLVEGSRIARMAAPGALDLTGARVVDGTGRTLVPGFIDLHAHADLAVAGVDAPSPDAGPRVPRGLDAALEQGITTVVVGQDGIGYTPVDDAVLPLVARQIAGWNGPLDPSRVTWRDIGGYLDAVDHAAVNVAALVPQGNLRMLTTGFDDRPATASELDRMRAMLADGLDAGAVGLSSGLTYAPGMYAPTAELESLAEVVASRGGYWAPHTRSYGVGALEAYDEVLGIGRRTGCAVHLTHATMNFAVNRGRAGELLDRVDAALADGVDVTLDSYPYLPGATTLSALLPGWFSAGGPDRTLERLTSGRDRAALADAFAAGSDGFHGTPADWSLIEVVAVGDASLHSAVGRTVAELAAAEGVDPVDVVVDLLIRDVLATGILMHVGDEGNLRRIMAHPAHTIGTDGILVGDRPHPRGWGTVPRYLARYVRELGVLSLPELVRHGTSAAARRLRMPDRGLVREGLIADLVLFDAETVADRATFEEPRTAPCGIDLVVVGGEVAVDHGRRTSAHSGRVLRASADRRGAPRS